MEHTSSPFHVQKTMFRKSKSLSPAIAAQHSRRTKIQAAYPLPCPQGPFFTNGGKCRILDTERGRFCGRPENRTPTVETRRRCVCPGAGGGAVADRLHGASRDSAGAGPDVPHRPVRRRPRPMKRCSPKWARPVYWKPI